MISHQAVGCEADVPLSALRGKSAYLFRRNAWLEDQAPALIRILTVEVYTIIIVRSEMS